MDYRIIVETEKSGRKRYYIQKSFLWYFWIYLRECRDITMYRYRVWFDTLLEAEQEIQSAVNSDYERSQQRVIKREVYQR